MEKALIGILILLLTGSGMAASQVQADPGLVKADSPMYGLDVAFDNALAKTPFSSPGEVAHERASEMAVAFERNNTDAFRKASKQLNRSVERADQRHERELERAAAVLRQRVMNGTASEEAEKGLENAVTNIEQAKNRIPDKFTTEPKPDGNDSRGFLPDLGDGPSNPDPGTE